MDEFGDGGAVLFIVLWAAVIVLLVGNHIWGWGNTPYRYGP